MPFDIALFHGCGSHLKLLECVVDGPGEVVLETTPAEDRYIVLSAKGTINVSCCLRMLRKLCIRPVVCVPLTKHRTAHLQWCREHHNLTEQDLRKSWFSLSSDCRRHIWREISSRKYP
ncbi:hypothetical protein TNCV_3426431 [Trichonephila clavipes]|nr:hypothetical protein TNCV_3426431 [Trichonephila clavipes]